MPWDTLQSHVASQHCLLTQQQASIGMLGVYTYIYKKQLDKATTAQGTGLKEVTVPR